MKTIKDKDNKPPTECATKLVRLERAPRSGQQYKVGPPFEDTIYHCPIYISSTNEEVFPAINARIDRGYDLIDGSWIGYKRNYFTLVAGFKFDDKDLDIVAKEKFHTYDNIKINSFSMALTSKCYEDEQNVLLIQHTAKRDYGPQVPPPVYPIIPGNLPSHLIMKESANIRNPDKVEAYNKLFFPEFCRHNDECILSTYPERFAQVARYERIQFSSEINIRRTGLISRRFKLEIELRAILDNGNEVLLATAETPPLIIRGRSPSNYKETMHELEELLETTDILKRTPLMTKEENIDDNLWPSPEPDTLVRSNIIKPKKAKRRRTKISIKTSKPALKNPELDVSKECLEWISVVKDTSPEDEDPKTANLPKVIPLSSPVKEVPVTSVNSSPIKVISISSVNSSPVGYIPIVSLLNPIKDSPTIQTTPRYVSEEALNWMRKMTITDPQNADDYFESFEPFQENEPNYTYTPTFQIYADEPERETSSRHLDPFVSEAQHELFEPYNSSLCLVVSSPIKLNRRKKRKLKAFQLDPYFDGSEYFTDPFPLI